MYRPNNSPNTIAPVDRNAVVSIDRRIVLKSLLASGGTIGINGLLAACNSTRPYNAARQPTDTPTEHEAAKQPRYPSHKVVASVFWVGEGATKADFKISNVPSEWEDDSRKTFGGFDDPAKRDGYGLPQSFRPLQNPYYFALPASEFGDKVDTEQARAGSYWPKQAHELRGDEEHSVFKGKWAKITDLGSGEMVFGQWKDTGPSDDEDSARDYNYVFGTDKPANEAGLGAGIDLSPTIAYAFGMHKNIDQASFNVLWEFVDEKDVPHGPWRNFAPIDSRTHWAE